MPTFLLFQYSLRPWLGVVFVLQSFPELITLRFVE